MESQQNDFKMLINKYLSVNLKIGSTDRFLYFELLYNIVFL